MKLTKILGLLGLLASILVGLGEYLVSGEGLASDQTALIHFGLEQDSEVKSLKIKYADGDICELNNLKINSIIDIEKEIVLKLTDTLIDAN